MQEWHLIVYPAVLWVKSQWWLQLTHTGVRCEVNSGMTLHTLVNSSDTFSCHCNSLSSPLSIVIQEQFLHFSSTVAFVYKPVYFPMQLVQLQLCVAMYPDPY